tara:strand:- start:976 stop:1161 length:186 start_codon:yes stop_codon:yes gene_type:complete
MKWIKKLFGLRTPIEKKKAELSKMRQQAMIVQRNGDIRAYSELSKKIEELEDEIVNMIDLN